MENVYATELHHFISEYFKNLGCTLRIIDEDYFQVKYPDGSSTLYTYKPRVASENRSVHLIARGSKALLAIMKDCLEKSMLSQVQVCYTEQSVRDSVGPKTCCNLCPFYVVCEEKTGCCDLCSYYKVCNSHLVNAEFNRLGEVLETKKVAFFAFVFLVNISSDYAVHLKTQLRMLVLLNYPNGTMYDEDVVVLKMDNLDFGAPEIINPISRKEWDALFQKARDAVEDKLEPYMSLFRYHTATPLEQKIKSIVSKYTQEYADNFTSLPAEKLERLQTEALTYCEREFRLFAVNCDCNLENAFVLNTTIDKRDLVYRDKEDHEIHVEGKILLNKVEISCSQCGLDIDKGYVCPQGHVYCQSCADICSSCHRLICHLCDEDMDTCQTCGETICKACTRTCDRCGAISCPDHQFVCHACKKSVCLDCIEVCTVCRETFCLEHIGKCYQCSNALCAEHQNTCSVCGKVLCPNHTILCSVCGIPLCQDHVYSSISGAAACKEHITSCSQCLRTFTVQEVTPCTRCGIHTCEEHTYLCTSCHMPYCMEHISLCPGCGKYYCQCTPFRSCKFCGIEYCPSCLDTHGVCKGCNSIKKTVLDEAVTRQLKSHDPSWDQYKTYRKGQSGNMTILLAGSPAKARMAVIHPQKGVVADKNVKLLDFIKLVWLKGGQK
jgi:hypothetical protein